MKEDISIDDPSPHELYQEGLKAYREKDYQNALLYFNQALEQDPRYESALNAKGVVLHSLGRYSEAVTSFDLVLSINPMNEKSRQNRDKAQSKILPSNSSSTVQPEKVQKRFILKPNYYLLFTGIMVILSVFDLKILPFAVVFSAVFVYMDSKQLRAGSQAEYGSFIDTSTWSPLSWSLVTLILWIIFFPVYIIKRRSIFNYNEIETFGPDTFVSPAEKIIGMILIVICNIGYWVNFITYFFH